MSQLPTDAIQKIAEDSMPGWKAVEVKPLGDSIKSADSDFAGVSLEQLRTKFGADLITGGSNSRQPRALSSDAPVPDTHLVRMRSTNNSDNALGDKVAVVSQGRVVGIQG